MTGTAVLAMSANPKVGTALHAIVRVRFDKSVGLATIGAATGGVTVTPDSDLTAVSASVATLRGSAGAGRACEGHHQRATGSTGRCSEAPRNAVRGRSALANPAPRIHSTRSGGRR